MKKLLIALLSLPCMVMGQSLPPTGLSSPILTNFWLNQFEIHPELPGNTSLIKLHLNSQQFDTGGTTITITNGPGTQYITNLYVTNIYSSNIFVTNIDASTIVTTNLYVTNIFNTFLVTSNIVAGNIQGTPPHLAMFTVDDFTLGDSIVTQDTNTNNGIVVNGTGAGQIVLGGPTGVDKQAIVFGSDGTNVLYRSGKDLYYTNSNNDVQFAVINGIGNAVTVESQGTAGVISGDGGMILRQFGNQVELYGASFFPVVDMTEDLGQIGNRWRSLNLGGTNYIWGYANGAGFTNYSRLAISHGGTNSYILFSSQAAGDNSLPRPSVFDRNIGALETTGDTAFFDMFQPTQTNQVAGAMTFAHVTNGVDRVDWIHRRFLFNPGANALITLPTGPHNISGASFTITNNTMVRIDVETWGDTSSSALQTNASTQVTFLP